MGNVINLPDRSQKLQLSPKTSSGIGNEQNSVNRAVENLVPQGLSAQVEEGSNIISGYIQKYSELVLGTRLDEAGNLDPVYMTITMNLYTAIEPRYREKTNLEVTEAMLSIIDKIRTAQQKSGDSGVHEIIIENNYQMLKEYIILECILFYRENPEHIPD